MDVVLDHLEQQKIILTGIRVVIFEILLYPIQYVKVLIQIGHEPMAPIETTSLFFGKPVLEYPNAFRYILYIKSIDGFCGCYRGLCPKLAAYFTETLVNKELMRHFPEDQTLWQVLKSNIIATVCAIVLSQPFNVLTVLLMSELVAKKAELDCGIVCLMALLYKDSGVFGFFRGLVPRLIGEVMEVTLTETSAHIIGKLIVTNTETWKGHTKRITSELASNVTYPFELISRCMIVTNSGLMAGSPPAMPHYANWLACWLDLSCSRQIKRGSSLFMRYKKLKTTPCCY